MTLFKTANCPSCNGPITFFEVMSILTPLQAIDCSTCGTLVFLKHKVELFAISIGLAALVLLFSFFAFMREGMSVPLVFSAGIGFMVVAEFIMVAHIIRKKDLVVRRER